MASTVLTDPEGVPSGEAAHASLLLAHVAWERAARPSTRRPDYHPVLRQFEASNPNMWQELKSSDSETLIGSLITYKRIHYPNDDRQIVVCGMRGDNVRVEWIDPPERTDRSSRARSRARPTQ
jgi:hypothetical protein